MTLPVNFWTWAAAVGAVLLLGKSSWYKKRWRIEESPVMDRSRSGAVSAKTPENMSVFQAFLPYIILTVLTLAVLLIKPLKEFLGQFQIGFSFPEMITGYGFRDAAADPFSPIALFTHAGMFLLISAVSGFCYFYNKEWLKRESAGKIGRRTGKKTVPSSVSVVCFIAMSKVMGGTGQTIVMAQGIAEMMGSFYAALSPIVGLLGAFMTSSNMASNLFLGASSSRRHRF